MERHLKAASPLIPLLLTSMCPSAFADLDGHVEVATGKSDTRPHVAYQLENGLKVLLVSDRRATNAVAALTVRKTLPEIAKRKKRVKSVDVTLVGVEPILKLGGKSDARRLAFVTGMKALSTKLAEAERQRRRLFP